MIACVWEWHNNLLEPNEIDNYFKVIKKPPQPKSAVGHHTRVVNLIKLALPSIAAVFAVVLLVFPSLNQDIRDFSLDFSLSHSDIEKMNIEKTTIYFTDSKNRVNNFTAKTIKETSAGSKMYDLISPEAIMPLDNGEWINVRSPSGIYNQDKALLELDTDVEAFYSRGMSVKSSQAFFNFKDSVGYSSKPVTGDGFLGKIDSEGFRFSAETETLTFLGKTRVIINEESLQKE